MGARACVGHVRRAQRAIGRVSVGVA